LKACLTRSRWRSMSGEGSPPHSRDKAGKDTTGNPRRDAAHDNPPFPSPSRYMNLTFSNGRAATVGYPPGDVSKGRRLCENSASDSVSPRRATVIAVFSHAARPQASKIRVALDPLTVFAQPRRRARLRGSPREGPESAPKPPVDCEREISFTGNRRSPWVHGTPPSRKTFSQGGRHAIRLFGGRRTAAAAEPRPLRT
jgi:hypothetical protein